MRLLLVEDEPRLAGQLKRHLEREAFAVDLAADGREALRRTETRDYDCILLDLGLPGALDGMAVCRRLRQTSRKIPVLMLTARDRVTDRVAGLDAGADDYLVKPFALEEVAARVRALLRRPREAQPIVLEVADLRLHTGARFAERGGGRVMLTAREFALLELLMRKAGKVLDRAEIAHHVWDENFDPASNIIDVYINRLRNKLDHGFDPALIHTVRGQGYVLRAGFTEAP